MQKQGIKPMGVGKPAKTVPSPGAVSSVGVTGAAPKPRVKNTRDYGKAFPDASPSPPADPFGMTDGASRLGGI